MVGRLRHKGSLVVTLLTHALEAMARGEHLASWLAMSQHAVRRVSPAA